VDYMGGGPATFKGEPKLETNNERKSQRNRVKWKFKFIELGITNFRTGGAGQKKRTRKNAQGTFVWRKGGEKKRGGKVKKQTNHRPCRNRAEEGESYSKSEDSVL